jgi:hypothetical protein
LCWGSKDCSNKGISATETANVLGEYVALDPRSECYDDAILHIAAMFVDGNDIDTLVSRGHDVNAKDENGATPIAYAVEYGNASAYLALLTHGADWGFSYLSIENMLLKAVTFQSQMPESTFLAFPERADYGSIIRHILKHGSPNLNLAFPIPLGDKHYPPSVRGHSTTARQLAQAHGTKTEACFLTLLLESGHPDYFTKKDKRRLHALRLEGQAPQGFVLGDDEDLSEDGIFNQSENPTDDDDDDDDGEDDDHNHEFESDDSSTHEDTSDEGEEQFWDAEQDL